MPCLDVTMPAAGQETRERLAAMLTEAFAEATGHPAEIFGIHFDEYGPGMASSGGTLVTGDDERPYLDRKSVV